MFAKTFFRLLLIAVLTAGPGIASAQTFGTAVPVLSPPPQLSGIVDQSWKGAAPLPVLYDFTYQRDGQPTTVYVAQDTRALYVAFEATQKAALVENSETNGPGVMNDDNVEVVLWPQGTSGFSYTFAANARGARYQSSGENTAYSPDWNAVARRTADGYSVTMRIPFNIMRTAGSHDWKVQFARVIQANNSTQVWEHVAGQRNAEDPTFAGTLTNVGGAQKTTALPPPRVQIYGLAEGTNQANGGSTSRMGADAAIPVTANSSFLASFHPDYSNVEIDQQTIAPTAFARFYSEVRPFFTQLNQFNYHESCTNCPTLLYTPAIPTFRDAYAYEGAQGDLRFAAFDALGYSRQDDAEAFDYNHTTQFGGPSINFQRVAVHLPGFNDVTTSANAGWAWQQQHIFAYFNGAEDRGTNVTDPGFGDYTEWGAGHFDKDTTWGFSAQKIGPQFLPADGFVQQPDVSGFSVFYNRTLHFGAKNALQDIVLSNFYTNQHDHNGRPANVGINTQINFDFAHEITLHVYGGNFRNETVTGEYLPFSSSNGAFLGYKTETSTPTYVAYAGGPYYHGALGTWNYLTTQPLTRKVHLTFEVDENAYSPSGVFANLEPSARQWLERVGVDWQMSRYASFDVGARRIIGRNLPNAFQVPNFNALVPCGGANPFSPFDCVDASNVSAAFHFLAGHNEFYAVYGNPNNLSTLPAVYLKWIRYVGAEKGT